MHERGLSIGWIGLIAFVTIAFGLPAVLVALIQFGG